MLNPRSSNAILLSTCKVLKSTCIDDKIFVPGSKIYARGFKNRDTAWVEYLLGFEIIVLVAVFIPALLLLPILWILRGGKANLSV